MSNRPSKCEKCGAGVVMVEYPYGNKYRYDGVSEYVCEKSVLETPECDWRIGRWCGEVLEKNMVERPFCDGGGHPRVFTIEQPKDTEHYASGGQSEASEREL